MRDHADRTIDFGRTVGDYEQFRPGFPESFFQRVEDLGWIQSGQRVLDLGTGTGSLALGFAERGLDATGIDIASELLAAARQSATERDLQMRFVEGRAEATAQPDNSFDLVSAGQCWWWFDSEAAAAEASRVLVSGGRLLIASFSYVPSPGSVAGRTEDLILEHNPGWAKAGWPGIHPDHIDALDAAGFVDVESFSYVVDVRFTHESWRGRIRTCNGVGSALRSDEVDVFDADLATMLRQEFPPDLSVPHRIFATSGVQA